MSQLTSPLLREASSKHAAQPSPSCCLGGGCHHPIFAFVHYPCPLKYKHQDSRSSVLLPGSPGPGPGLAQGRCSIHRLLVRSKRTANDLLPCLETHLGLDWARPEDAVTTAPGLGASAQLPWLALPVGQATSPECSRPAPMAPPISHPAYYSRQVTSRSSTSVSSSVKWEKGAAASTGMSWSLLPGTHSICFW